MSRKIAIVLYGGVGGGFEAQGVPILVDFIERISSGFPAKFEITVFSFLRPDTDFVPKNYKIIHCNGILSSSSTWLAIKFCWLFFRHHKKEKYDIIHCIWGFPAGFWGVLMAKILNIKSIVSLQGGETTAIPALNYGNMLRFKTRFGTRWACKNATQTTVLTHFQKNLAEKYHIKTQKDILVVPYGAMEGFFQGNLDKWACPLAEKNVINFLHVANLNAIKQTKQLIDIFVEFSKNLPSNINTKLTIIGTGTLENDIKNYILKENLQEKIVLLGVIPHKNLPQYYQKADILLHNSIYEAQAVVVNEALAGGLLVIGTHVGIIADLADICVVSVKENDNFALKTTDILQNKEQLRALLQNSKEYSHKNTAQNTANTFMQIYAQLFNILNKIE